MAQQPGTNGNGSNGNGNGDNGNGTLPDLTNREMLKLLLDEISYVRREILEEVGIRMDRLEQRIDKIEKELHDLRIQVHQNHIAFMTAIGDCEKRLAALEG